MKFQDASGVFKFSKGFIDCVLCCDS